MEDTVHGLHVAFCGTWHLHGLQLSDSGFGDVPDTVLSVVLGIKKGDST